MASSISQCHGQASESNQIRLDTTKDLARVADI